MSDKLYAYGVTEDGGDLAVDETGVDGADDIYTVSHGPLAAIVSDIEELDPERSDENVRAHDDVLRAVLVDAERTVVPMQFGMVFEGKRPLKNILRTGRPTFSRSLNDIEGTYELGVKLVADEGARVDRAAVEADVDDRLSEVSVGTVENDLFSDRLVFNRSYLVKRDEREAFDEAIDDIEAAHSDLTLQYTGPWAPYNFVDIAIEAQ
ncbi:GvpL/GvpF family gas vesicle protein [Halomarina oriensis]|uniref:Protein gvpF n=1 Tax=Halomarina oriensis TaxID=671145 RepID=A0A6B0GRT0_9EURY|nr:GvpL/GvpF family gas vesicle protein [Halomarina oriensis]MWG36017.1 protein gvpF [Halomarina oriensis]